MTKGGVTDGAPGGAFPLRMKITAMAQAFGRFEDGHARTEGRISLRALLSCLFGFVRARYMSLSTCCPVMSFLPLCWNSCDTDSDEGMNMIDSDQHESSRKDHPGVEILCQVVRRSSAMHVYRQ